ncbi:SEN1 N terminal-domain-containing protein [Lentinula aciculospora]|uniref:SEN1 N terminal-domain-containing protein n=1 Tax=Lentinula aciculospora TaxID=153920 RepID=A0A9W9AHS7_9AGAR|nr:SEN1 N terminal-domain-containing protein [Lentinula aciculospora]
MGGSVRIPPDLTVQSLLQHLRDIPKNSESVQEAELETIYAYLERSTVSKSSFHWFCQRADPLLTESAIFLLRLFAYNSPKVEAWKGWLNNCLGGCVECVLGLEKAKISSKDSYFGAFQDQVMRGFWESFNDWELEFVLAQISDASGWKNSSDIPTPTLYRMICNFQVFQDSRIQFFLEQNAPFLNTSDWPADPIPPAMLVLMMHDNATLREWALKQVSRCTTIPISQDHALSLPYDKALEMISSPFTSTTPMTPDTSLVRLITEPMTLWSSFYSVLRVLHPKHLTSPSSKGIDIRHVVTGHLHGHGPEFKNVLRCFSLVLKRLGKDLWHGESPEYPQIVFDAFKDNLTMLTLLHEEDLSSERNPWFFNWLPEFLLTIRDQPVYFEVVAKITDFMCEELQHERFSNARPIVIACAARLLRAQNLDGINSAVTNVLDIHAETLVTVAFASSHQKVEWKIAREVTRDLIQSSLVQDLRNIQDAISRCTVVLAQSQRKVEKDGSKPRIDDNGRDSMAPLVIREQIWKNIYVHLQPNDHEGLASLLSALASAAHLDPILKNSFASALNFPGFSNLVDSVNRSLEMISSGFSELTSGYEMSLVATQVLQLPGVAKDLVKLMLSPVAVLHGGAMGIVTQADDSGSDGRRECFQWLFEKFAEESFLGSFELLKVFNEFAPRIPEACSLSKSLVRCFTDIIGVLCSGHHGLLHQSVYLRPHGPARHIPELWTLMCKTITVIFKRTPSWSLYYRSEEMTEWMRDALIFARDILGERPVFESAAEVASASQDSSKILTRMLINLHEILPELSRWLRLTDEELLHQSCILIHSLLELFRDKHSPPQQVVLQKLSKQVADVRNRDSSSITCRLDPAKLAPLEAILATFDDDDDVEIVELKPISLPKDAAKSATKKPKVEMKLTPTVYSKSLPASTSKSKLTRFSAVDQERLDSATSIPKFRKPSTTGVKSAAPLPSTKSSAVASTGREKEESSSSSSDESAEEESQGTLMAGLIKLQQSPRVKKRVERRQVKMLDLPHLRQNAQETRLLKRDEARQKALRFKPDISGLHRTLLSWDYQHDGETPPKTQLQLRNVPDTFSDFNHYRAIFEPLLLMECWAQLLQSKGDLPENHECKITSRLYNGQWSDLEVIFVNNLRKEWFLTENDVVLLRHPEGKCTVLAKALNFKRPGKDPAEAGLRCYIPPDTRDPGLQTQSSWQISKVFSLSTLHREYAALVAAEYYDFADRILRPYLALPSRIDPKEIKQTMDKCKVNEPQAKAIVSALKSDGFVLIQGPPGTGKTTTICALISTSSQTLSQGPPKNFEKRKILLCAPSNAAIDEIVSRLKDRYRSLRVVRTGATQSISPNVKDVSLDYLIGEKLSTEGHQESSETANEILSARQEFQTIKKVRQDKIQELQKLRDSGARFDFLEVEVKQLTIKSTALRQRLDNLRDKHTSESRKMDTARRRARDEVLRESDVICSTLSGTGHENLEQYEFEMVIIDEAAQAIELSSLIPLKYRCRRCIMVGDPQQLPPTVISMEASKYQYNQSLFVRLQKQRPDAVHLLSIQYRMHPDISQLPSRMFYDNRLQDGPDMDSKTIQPWHAHPKFGTYRFFNVKGGLEEFSGRSTKNQAEAQVAVALFNRLRKDFPSVDFGFRVGIVSMYSAQIRELKIAFEQRFGREVLTQVDFRTVDGFQGQEKDIIILSCVRAGPGIISIGHVKDIRRMNVAITRAKSSLFILGNAATLERSNETWRTIVADSKARNLFAEVDVSYFTAPSAITTTSISPRKTKLTKAALPVPPPLDLSTPRELIAATLTQPAPTKNQPKPQPNASINPTHALDDSASMPSDNHTGKRKLDKIVDPKPTCSNVKLTPPAPSNSNTLVPPPARKRPKQGPSLFIPKNKNNRP